MKKFIALFIGVLAVTFSANAQTFPESIDPGDYNNFVLPMPPSPLSNQILFIGGVDLVATTETYGNAAGYTPAKQWHDFIGFTPATQEEIDAYGAQLDESIIPGGAQTSFLGWVSINHERIQANDMIGDGGGMTVFAVGRGADGQLYVLDQTLEDGRQGRFFNVDFANTVGETGMNCGGITSLADGRIWTAEEWFRRSTNSYFANGDGVRDTTDYTVATDLAGDFDGTTINKIDNFNWMVEIDPRQAKAIRKQYNWGRQGFEGGVVMTDNQTVYFGEDSRPGLFCRFIADTPGDFTSGTLSYYAYDEEAEQGYWVDYDSESFASTLSMNAYNTAEFNGDGEDPAFASQGRGALPWRGEDAAAMFIRNEWFAADSVTGLVYWTETGNDSFWDEFALFTPRGINNPEGDRYIEFDADGNPTDFNGKIGSWLIDAARMRFPELNNVSNDSVRNWLVAGRNFRDSHGRILCYDPKTSQTFVFLEGGPYPGDDNGESQELGDYPAKHFSNPDGLNVMYLPNGKRYMVICEDLNGRSFNRVPAGVNNSTCELFLLDLDIENPTVDDLVRISVVPNGAEVTGAQPTSDGFSLLVNSQHPRTSNPFPFNNSLTYAINGFENLAEANDISVADLVLVDAASGKDITTLADGDIIQINDLANRKLNIRAMVGGEPASVSFSINGTGGKKSYSKVENVAPFYAFGDNPANGAPFGDAGLFNQEGSFDIVVTPYTEKGAAGAAGLSQVLQIRLEDGGSDKIAASNELNVEFNAIQGSFDFTNPVEAAIYNTLGQQIGSYNSTTAIYYSDFSSKLDNDEFFIMKYTDGETEGVKKFKVVE